MDGCATSTIEKTRMDKRSNLSHHPAFLLSSLRAYAACVYKKWGSRQKDSVPPTPKWREKETNVKANRAPTNPADHTSGERSTRSQEADISPQILWCLYDLISGSSIAARHFEHGSERFRAINLGVHIAHAFAPAATKEVCARKLDGMWSLIGQLGGRGGIRLVSYWEARAHKWEKQPTAAANAFCPLWW